MLFALSTARAVGKLKRAVLPAPLALPVLPAKPAKVLTTRAGVILRMVLLLVSATKILPILSMATATGNLKRAVLPVPLALPGLPAKPAKVVTTPAGVILRMVLLTVSAT